MKPLYELKRYSFMWKRDGFPAAVLFAQQGIKVYTAGARDRRLKHGRHDAYRKGYLESAWSFRWLLRHVHNKQR